MNYTCLKSKSFGASDSTITNQSLVGGLEAPQQHAQHHAQQTLHDLIIIFLTSMALNDSTQLQKLDLADIMTRLSEFIAPEVSQLSVTVGDKMRLDVIFSQLSEFLSVSKQAQESISSRIICMVNDYFKKESLIDNDVFTFIHHNMTCLFDDALVPNLLVIRSALNNMLNKNPVSSVFTIYISQDDCGSWNTTHYPAFLLPKDVSILVKTIPNSTESNQIDIKSLQEVIESDLVAGNQPLMIVCRVGTSLSTLHDDIPAILKLNNDHKCWIHVEGIDAIFYSLLDSNFTKCFDSITLELVNWVPNMTLPKITLFQINPWILNDVLCLKLKTGPWSSCKNSFRIPEKETILNRFTESEQEKSVDIFSNTPPVKQLLALWTWLNFQSPLILKKRLNDIREAIQVLKANLENLENLVVLSNNDKEYRGIMFRYASCTHSSTADKWKESYDNLATRFIFSKLTALIPRLSLISVNSKIFIQVEIFYVETFLKELPDMISNLLTQILKACKEIVAVQEIVAGIPQIQYIFPNQILCVEGDKPHPILSLGGLVYTPHLISLLSKTHPQVLMDLHPFQHKLYDQLCDLDISLGGSENQVPCLILDIPCSFDDFYPLEIIQVIMESAKSLESAANNRWMDQVSVVIKQRILKSEKKFGKESESSFGIIDSLFSMVEYYFDGDGMDNNSLSDSFNLELGD